MPQYKERESNLDECLSLFKYNLPKTSQIFQGIPPSIYSMESKFKTAFVLLVFYHGF